MPYPCSRRRLNAGTVFLGHGAAGRGRQQYSGSMPRQWDPNPVFLDSVGWRTWRSQCGSGVAAPALGACPGLVSWRLGAALETTLLSIRLLS